jgi:hypothetical protein
VIGNAVLARLLGGGRPDQNVQGEQHQLRGSLLGHPDRPIGRQPLQHALVSADELLGNLPLTLLDLL